MAPSLVYHGLIRALLSLALDMCDCSDVYIVVNGIITADGTVNANERNKRPWCCYANV